MHWRARKLVPAPALCPLPRNLVDTVTIVPEMDAVSDTLVVIPVCIPAASNVYVYVYKMYVYRMNLHQSFLYRNGEINGPYPIYLVNNAGYVAS
jgi:hypothetical protein